MLLGLGLVAIIAVSVAVTVVVTSGDEERVALAATVTPTARAGATPPTLATPVPTNTAVPGGTLVPVNTPTTAPATATPPPAATATPAPVTIAMPSASAGGGSVEGRHLGPLGIVWADAGYGFDAGNGRIKISAFIPTVGSNENPTATGFLARPFTPAAALGGSFSAQVSGNVSWVGTLAGNGVAGAGAEITITLKLMDGSNVVAQTIVHTREIRESSLTVGGSSNNGSASPTLSATLIGGRTYTVRLEATCNAYTGLVSGSTHCMYGDNDAYADGYIRWGGFQVLLIP